MAPGFGYHFDDSYQEDAILGDGTRVRLRTIRPSDRELLAAGFAELSAESRYLRFFTSKPSLSEDELRALTALDGVDHFALGAVIAGEQGEQGLGVARFARSPESPQVAEAAVVVLDSAQGKGLGTLLLQRLAAAARERGVRQFRCEFLACNSRVKGMLERRSGAHLEQDGELIRAEAPVPEASFDDRPFSLDRNTPSYSFLGQSARGAIQVRFRRLLLKWSG